MRKKAVTVSLTIFAAVLLGYIFLLAWLVGVLSSKYVAGPSSGERGRFKSVIIPWRRWRFHLHHWLYSAIMLSASLALGFHFVSRELTCGLLAGTIFQGIYFYDDWHVVVLQRHTRKNQPGENERFRTSRGFLLDRITRVRRAGKRFN